VVGIAALALAGCRANSDASHGPPDAEFLFAAGDSTYWVRSSAEGLRVRSAPILLTQIENRFFEVYIADDGVDFEDASFSAARVYARDVTRRDSISLFDDGRVIREAENWKRQHPDDTPIDPDTEDSPSDPRTVVAEEIEIVDVHGPWVTLSHLLNLDVADQRPHEHAGRRYVIDVRNGSRATLQTLFGDAEARRLIAAAHQSLRQLTDSIRATTDDRAAIARETLDSFRFDSTSFGLTDIARAPAVTFMVPGNGTDGEALALNLPPISVTAPAWWTGVKQTLPAWAADSSTVRWTRAKYQVVARPNAESDALALALLSPARAGQPSAAKEWPVATVPMPAYQLIPLDAPPVSADLHAALSRAFDASKALDGVGQVALSTRRAREAAPRARALGQRAGFRLSNWTRRRAP
jgi:hypothetical protein